MWGKKFIKVLLALLITFLGWIYLAFNTHGLLLKLELALLVVFLFASFIILLGIFVEEQWSWTLSFIFFAIAALNMLFMRYFIAGNSWLFAISLLAALAGFMISIANMGRDKEVIEEPMLKPEVPKVEMYGEKQATPAKKAIRRKK